MGEQRHHAHILSEEALKNQVISNIQDVRFQKPVAKQTGNFRDQYKFGPVKATTKHGEVRKCRNKITGVVRAVRILDKAKMTKDEEQMYANEYKFMSKMDHPNLLKMFETYEDEKRYYLVSELLSGGELFDFILQKNCPLAEEDAAAIIKQVLVLLSYMHKLGYVHRDVKAESI